MKKIIFFVILIGLIIAGAVVYFNYKKNQADQADLVSQQATEHEKEQMFEAARALIRKYWAEGMKVELKIIRKLDKWALLEAIPTTIKTDNAAVVMEKVGDKWVARDFGAILPGWKEKVPELFK